MIKINLLKERGVLCLKQKLNLNQNLNPKKQRKEKNSMNKIWQKIIALLPVVLNGLPMEIAKKAIDAALDVIEAEVKKTPNLIDDVVVLPLIKLIRKIGQIPDYEESSVPKSSSKLAKMIDEENEQKGGQAF